MRIVVTPVPGSMAAAITDVPAFPGESFSLVIPERIGNADDPASAVFPQWTAGARGTWIGAWQQPGELSFQVTVTPDTDTVDIHIALTNEGSTTWSHGLAFNHFAGAKSSIGDHECARHWARHNGRFVPLTELPRVFSARPAVQVYAVQGAPPVSQVPYAQTFNATPNLVLEDWLAIRSLDGARLAAVVSKPALFLFQNMEYACIHSAAGFGSLQPGQTANALTRIYLVQATLQDWYDRKVAELG